MDHSDSIPSNALALKARSSEHLHFCRDPIICKGLHKGQMILRVFLKMFQMFLKVPWRVDANRFLELSLPQRNSQFFFTTSKHSIPHYNIDSRFNLCQIGCDSLNFCNFLCSIFHHSKIAGL